MNLILYATTSGATEDVAVKLAEMIGLPDTRLVNLRTDALEIEGTPDWVFAGTPTYGQGDWHYAWMRRHQEAGAVLKRSRRVALFGLGDSVHHGDTFAGGIGYLARYCAEIGVPTLGRVPEARPSPSVVDGHFPGLVVEYARERRKLEAIIGNWLHGTGYRRRGTSPASLHLI